MNHRDPKPTALLFNQQISQRSVEGLSELMTEDHVFKDGSGEKVEGKARMLEGWSNFFKSYPDYGNVFRRLESRGDVVVMLGYSTCSNEEALEGPAIWTARIENDLVAEWRVYSDSRENRSKLGME